jgi:hypothetical protein
MLLPRKDNSFGEKLLHRLRDGPFPHKTFQFMPATKLTFRKKMKSILGEHSRPTLSGQVRTCKSSSSTVPEMSHTLGKLRERPFECHFSEGKCSIERIMRLLRKMALAVEVEAVAVEEALPRPTPPLYERTVLFCPQYKGC